MEPRPQDSATRKQITQNKKLRVNFANKIADKVEGTTNV